MEKEDIQRALEREMIGRGVDRFRRHWDADVNRGDVSRQDAVKEMIEYQIEPLAKAIDGVRGRALAGRAGRKSVIIAALSSLESEVLAFMTAKEVINGLTIKAAYGTTQRILGKAVNDQILCQKLAEQDETAIEWVERECKRRKINTRHHKERYMRKMAQHRGAKHRDWTAAERIQVGAALIELFVQATGLCEIGHVRTGKKTKAVLQARPALLEWIDRRNDILALLQPEMLPMVVRPRAWEADCTTGGYLEHKVPLVKGTEENPEHLAALRASDTSAVREAVGHMDRTPYTINHEVLAIMEGFQERNWTIPGLEGAVELELPPKPLDIETNEEARKEYSIKARNVHEHNAAAVSMRLTFQRTLAIAQRFENERVLYFPNQLDFRGRVYPMPNHLNPQGPDFVRALLEFANERAVDHKALWWLKVNLANLFGEDKLTLEERAVWAEKHIQQVLDVANNPMGNLWWTTADKPWQFLAACFDWAWVERAGVSTIRVSMDGSCNGIQHFAALLLDPVAARAVNLADNPAPRDIYQEVADVVTSSLRFETDPQKRFWADNFLHLGIDRKICKRSVMVMPYGGTYSSTLKYVEQECRERCYQDSFGDDWPQAVVYLSRLVYDGTRTVVKSGAEVMDWLQSVAKAANTAKRHLRWTTPTGFVAEQKYVKYETKLVTTYLDGEAVRRTWDYDPTDKIDALRSRNGISPNYVHSMDAAAMMMAVNKAAARGVSSFHCIHDDFGTHAADTQCLYESLREAFVEMYSEDQLLRTFGQFTKILPNDFVPLPPERGGFDLNEVLRSRYFFS